MCAGLPAKSFVSFRFPGRVVEDGTRQNLTCSNHVDARGPGAALVSAMRDSPRRAFVITIRFPVKTDLVVLVQVFILG